MTWTLLLALGAVLGWLGTVILHSGNEREIIALVAAGIVGAMLGALVIAPSLSGPFGLREFSLPGLLLSLTGSFVALAVVYPVIRLTRMR